MSRKIVALAGGVGGAKLALGLSLVVPASDLTVIVNTADDFVHLGLHVAPDLDTVMYTLAGIANPATGWGQAAETWEFMGALGRLGAETWFQLGDRDLATHVERTRRMAAGESLSQVTRYLANALGIGVALAPMSDDPVRTFVETDEGVLAFQHYFVRRKCEPKLAAVRFDGSATARASPAALSALADSDLSAIVICPSNPYVSVDPILAVADLRAALAARKVPLVAVSPIVGGRAIKGPAAKMMAELGIEQSVLGIARHYHGLIDGLVIDRQDAASAADITALGLAVHVADTIMVDDESKRRLAGETLGFAARLRPGRRID